VNTRAIRTSIVALAALPLVLAAVAATQGSGRDAPRPSHSLSRVEARGLPAVRTPASAAATWCGTPQQADLAPNLVAGHTVKWIYLLPSDGADRFATFASVMQTDAEAIDAWWRREDPVRTPRNDLTQLSCGPQLDLAVVRAALTGAQLSGDDARFGAIFNSLSSRGFFSPFTKYLVYYDGPIADQNVCGQGGGEPSGVGLAVVLVQSCAGFSTAAIGAHELLHTFGAVPGGAPHDCPAPNDAHTCDNEADLMHPFLDESPLDAKLLDPGRDDYYGHGSSFGDSQDSPWLVQLDRQTQLPVTISGPGRVAADVPGLLCETTCTTTWNAGTRLNLVPSPGPGQKLARWSGACSGAGSCAVTVGQGTTVSALFAPLVFRLSVRVSGRGSVRSSRSGITCRPRCSASFPSFTPLRLTARASRGWRFRSWAGACRGRRTTCTVPMAAATAVRAVFVRR
jgi:Divergent InlB B-repeat domain